MVDQLAALMVSLLAEMMVSLSDLMKAVLLVPQLVAMSVVSKEMT